jgi:hypothetical protein
MNWTTIFGMTAGLLLVLFALLRVERKRLWVALLFLAAPAVFLLAQWVNFKDSWSEVILSVSIAGVIAGGWWLMYGRKLPPQTSDNIKVWGQEAAPKPKPQEMQAEINRLQEEKQRLEAELRRLKGNGQTKDEGRPTKDER